MHDTTPGLIEAVSELARLRSAQKRAEEGCRKLYEQFEGQGYSRRAIDRALDLLDTSGQDEHAELVQAQDLLKKMRAPVQIEFTGLYENAVEGKRALSDLEDEGYWARMCGSSRVYRSTNEQERAAWMNGWDAANQLLRDIP